MNTNEVTREQRGGLTAGEIVSRSNDPKFFSVLDVLPNPDPILRKIGKRDDVFDAVGADAHVMGEKRSIRAALLKFEYRLVPGGEQAADKAAFELCSRILEQRPAPGMRWHDVIWNMEQAAFLGFRVHEIEWAREGSLIVPTLLADKPNRRFAFGMKNELRYFTRENMFQGLEADAFRFLLTRHMPSHDNPYGEALYSSCFWPYTFKHAGLKFFVKFCEKYGFPWPIGKYPEGTQQKDQEALAEALQKMVQDAVAVVPQGNDVEMLNQSQTGNTAHESLIHLCNAELSKALTSQTLTTEVGDSGSRALGDVHREKELTVSEADREMVQDTFNEFFSWITLINFAGAAAPRFEFFNEAEARKDWVDVLDKATTMIDVPVAFAHEVMQIPMPKEGEEIIARRQPAPTNPFQPKEFAAAPKPGTNEFSNQTLADQAARQADELIQQLPEKVRKLLDEVSTLEEFRQKLPGLYPEFNDIQLGELTAAALMTGVLDGMDKPDAA
jgi:phage gp29-like protein